MHLTVLKKILILKWFIWMATIVQTYKKQLYLICDEYKNFNY